MPSKSTKKGATKQGVHKEGTAPQAKAATPKTLKLRPPKPIPPKEGDIQRAVMRRLQLDGWLVVRINSGARKTENGGYFRAYIIQGLLNEKGAPASSGFSDVLAMKGDVQGGRFLLLEIKDAEGESTPPQKRFRAFAEKFGITVHTVRSVDDLKAIYEQEEP